MTISEPGGASVAPGMAGRIVRLLTASGDEWKRIEPEPATAQGLMLGWAAPLGLIPAAASVIHMSVIGGGLPGLAVVKLPLLAAAIGGVLQFLLLLAMTWVMGFLINALAPNFGGTQNPVQALKVSVYSGTAACALSILQAVPWLGALSLIGVVLSIFLMHNGLPVLMKSPPEKTFGYTLSVTGVMFILWIVAGLTLGSVNGALMAAGVMQSGGVTVNAGDSHGNVKIGGTTIDIGGLEKAAKQIEQGQVSVNAGGVTVNGAAVQPVDVEKLKALLPASLPGGLVRGEISSGSGGMAGMNLAGASATYASGDKSIEISLTDTSAMGALAGMAGAFGVQATREDADGFERTHTVDGRMTLERFSRSGKSATYGVMLANRFMLQAEGSNVSFDEVKAAADAVGIARVEALAKP